MAVIPKKDGSKISLYFCEGERRSLEIENERLMEEVVG